MRSLFVICAALVAGCSVAPQSDGARQLGSMQHHCADRLQNSLPEPLDAKTEVASPAHLSSVSTCFLSREPPALPQEAIAANIQGDVLVRIYFDASGRVERVEVLQSAHELLSNAVVSAVSTWRVRPYIREGKAASFVAHQVFTFKLTDS